METTKPTSAIPKDHAHIAYASMFSRSLALIIDVVFYGLCGLFAFIGLNAAMGQTSVVRNSYDSYFSIYEDSNLYATDESGNLVAWDLETYEEYETVMVDYFVNRRPEFYEGSSYDVYWYNVHMYGLTDPKGLYSQEDLDARYSLVRTTGPTLFQYDGTSYDTLAVPVAEVLPATLKAYYYDTSASSCVYAIAVTDLRACPDFVSAYHTWYDYSVFMPLVVSFGFFAIVFKFVIPMFFSYRKTLGKFFLKMGVIDRNGNQLPRWRMIPRFFVPLAAAGGLLCVSYFLTSSFLVFILGGTGLLLVSLIVASSNKNHRSLHDFVAGSAVVDLRNSTLDIYEEDKVVEAKKVTESEAEPLPLPSEKEETVEVAVPAGEEPSGKDE